MAVAAKIERFFERIKGRPNFTEANISFDHLLTILNYIKLEEKVGNFSIKANIYHSHFKNELNVRETIFTDEVIEYASEFSPKEIPEMQPDIRKKEYFGEKTTRYTISISKGQNLKGRLELLVSHPKGKNIWPKKENYISTKGNV